MEESHTSDLLLKGYEGLLVAVTDALQDLHIPIQFESNNQQKECINIIINNDDDEWTPSILKQLIRQSNDTIPTSDSVLKLANTIWNQLRNFQTQSEFSQSNNTNNTSDDDDDDTKCTSWAQFIQSLSQHNKQTNTAQFKIPLVVATKSNLNITSDKGAQQQQEEEEMSDELTWDEKLECLHCLATTLQQQMLVQSLRQRQSCENLTATSSSNISTTTITSSSFHDDPIIQKILAEESLSDAQKELLHKGYTFLQEDYDHRRLGMKQRFQVVLGTDTMSMNLPAAATTTTSSLPSKDNPSAYLVSANQDFSWLLRRFSEPPPAFSDVAKQQQDSTSNTTPPQGQAKGQRNRVVSDVPVIDRGGRIDEEESRLAMPEWRDASSITTTMEGTTTATTSAQHQGAGKRDNDKKQGGGQSNRRNKGGRGGGGTGRSGGGGRGGGGGARGARGESKGGRNNRRGGGGR